jgi:excisionase family DNA binding protein
VSTTVKAPRAEVEPLLMSAAEAAAFLSVSRSYFNRAIGPELARVRIGRRLLFRRDDVAAWAERRLAGAPRRSA